MVGKEVVNRFDLDWIDCSLCTPGGSSKENVLVLVNRGERVLLI